MSVATAGGCAFAWSGDQAAGVRSAFSPNCTHGLWLAMEHRPWDGSHIGDGAHVLLPPTNAIADSGAAPASPFTFQAQFMACLGGHEHGAYLVVSIGADSSPYSLASLSSQLGYDLLVGTVDDLVRLEKGKIPEWKARVRAGRGDDFFTYGYKHAERMAHAFEVPEAELIDQVIRSGIVLSAPAAVQHVSAEVATIARSTATVLAECYDVPPSEKSLRHIITKALSTWDVGFMQSGESGYDDVVAPWLRHYLLGEIPGMRPVAG